MKQISPDDNFQVYLLEQNYGQDGVIAEEEIHGVLSIGVAGRDVNSFKE